MVYTRDLKSLGGDSVPVRVRPRAQAKQLSFEGCFVLSMVGENRYMWCGASAPSSPASGTNIMRVLAPPNGWGGLGHNKRLPYGVFLFLLIGLTFAKNMLR